MNANHMIDWGKTAAEIQDDYAAVCGERDGLLAALGRLKGSFEFGQIAGIEPEGCERALLFINAAIATVKGDCVQQSAESETQDHLIVTGETQTAEPDADGWIEWNGGRVPVAEGIMVMVTYRDGKIGGPFPANQNVDHFDRDAGPAFWCNERQANDIVAYRVVKGGA